MADVNFSEVTPEPKPDLFEWNGTELIFIPVMMATGILGNALVLYVTHFRWKSAIFAFFIKILAWLDMVNLTVSQPMLLAITVDTTTPSFLPLCRLLSFVLLFTGASSAIVFVIIAANRYRKICHLSKSQVTLSLAKKLTGGSLVVGAGISLLGMWVFGRHTASFPGPHGPVNLSCCFVQDGVSVALLGSFAAVTGVTFMTVTGSLVLLYGFTIRALRKHDHRQSTMVRRPSTVSQSSTKRVATKHTYVFIAVTVVFFVTYTPYLVMMVLLIIIPDLESNMGPAAKAFFDLAKLFPLLSNVSNPVIYSFTSDKFREECRKVFKLRPCLRRLGGERKNSVTTSLEMSRSEDLP
ncbi:uncharacterized protein LOC143285890 [Babylonia areolata]|uniref:uncharacterized protein LOC143285890 n=1 Tax=Babylonia areolata TaxID=304850 RepID=UPI003FCF84D4